MLDSPNRPGRGAGIDAGFGGFLSVISNSNYLSAVAKERRAVARRLFTRHFVLVGSVSRYVDPGLGVGGRGSPRVTVLSGPLPPRGPVISYWPDLGAIWPGLKVGVFAIVLVSLVLPKKPLGPMTALSRLPLQHHCSSTETSITAAQTNKGTPESLGACLFIAQLPHS